MFKKSTVFILHFAPSLHFTLSQQSAFYTQSAFYPWSTVCSLCFTLIGLRWAQMTKPCFVTLEFFDFVKFTENIELPAV